MEFHLFSLCLLGFFFAQGNGQYLTVINLTLCTGYIHENVSRFKSDIYAVRADLSSCSNYTELSENATIGFRVFSWANTSVGKDPVIFIGRQGTVGGVVSWSIPLKPEGFDLTFDHVNRTMCPSNRTMEEEGTYLFYIDVFSSSIDPVPYDIAVEIVPHFTLQLDVHTSTMVGASSPQIHYFKFPLNVSAVTVFAYTADRKCAFVSIQNNTCPINDLLENARSRGIYQTMSRAAFLTVTENQVENREFVLIIITADFTLCHGPNTAPIQDIVFPNSSFPKYHEYSQNITIIVRELEPMSKFVLAVFLPILVFLLYLALVCVYAFLIPRMICYCDRPEGSKCIKLDFKCRYPWKYVGKGCSSPFLSGSVQNYDSIGESNMRENTGSVSDGEKSTVANTTTMEESVRSIREIREPDENKLMLPLTYTQKYSKLNKQYTIYSWNTITVGIFYALPAFQLVLSEQLILNSSGDEDRCYYNFECSHPFGVFTAFNNVWSNIGYFMLGFLFLFIVTIRKWAYSQKRKSHKDYVDSHGIPEFHGIYQAMGVALILEGFMSAFYHICPTDANFQFDTAFMFIIGGLFMVKLFQNRHPDINANAFIAFFSFAVIIFITLIGIYIDRNHPIVLRITLFIFVMILVSIFFFSFYKFHVVWTWESFKTEVKECTVRLPRHKCRFFKLLFIFCANILLGVTVVVRRSIDIPTSILGFFVLNLMLFLLIYTLQKVWYREPMTILPVVLAVGVIALWGVAFYFFILKASTNWQLTPAESRAENTECALLGFYDYHDIWHFFSASAMFFSFLFLLSLDDGLRETRRKDIHVF